MLRFLININLKPCAKCHENHDLRVATILCLRKTIGKVSPILVMLTSRSDSDFESSNVSLKENKPDGINPNSNDIDYYVRKNEMKILWFLVGCTMAHFAKELVLFKIYKAIGIYKGVQIEAKSNTCITEGAAVLLGLKSVWFLVEKVSDRL